MTDSVIRDGMIDQAQQQRMTRDTLIMQKVNGAHREAFKTRFPGQVEPCMRLTAERLQAILTRKPAELADPGSWNCTAQEIESLSAALYSLTQISKEYPTENAV